jgi:hypothetical protein
MRGCARPAQAALRQQPRQPRRELRKRDHDREQETFDRVVDEAWDPPLTLGVRLMSVIDDCAQHAGQAAFVRGIVLRR